MVSRESGCGGVPAIVKVMKTSKESGDCGQKLPSRAERFFFRSRLIHHEISALEVCAIERFDGLLRFISAPHFHKPEAPGSSGITIRDHVGGLDGSMLGKQFLQFEIRCRIGQVPNV